MVEDVYRASFPSNLCNSEGVKIFTAYSLISGDTLRNGAIYYFWHGGLFNGGGYYYANPHGPSNPYGAISTVGIYTQLGVCSLTTTTTTSDPYYTYYLTTGLFISLSDACGRYLNTTPRYAVESNPLSITNFYTDTSLLNIYNITGYYGWNTTYNDDSIYSGNISGGTVLISQSCTTGNTTTTTTLTPTTTTTTTTLTPTTTTTTTSPIITTTLAPTTTTTTTLSANTLFAVSQKYIMKSTNDGSTWSIVHTGATTDNYRAISFINPGTGFVFGSADSNKIGGALKTIDSGTTWIDQASNLPAIAADKNFACATKELGTNIYIGANDDTILKYTTSNDTWSISKSGITGWINSLYALNYKNIVGTRSETDLLINNLISTTNSGINWTISTMSGLTDDIVLDDVIFNGNTGFIISSQSDDQTTRVLKSVNSGETWSKVSASVFINEANSGVSHSHTMNSISFPTPGNIFIFGSSDGSVSPVSGKCWASSDSGSTWIDLSSNLPETVNSILSSVFINESIGWVGTDEGKILKTTDGGTNWSEYSTNIATTIMDIYIKRY
jgi:photosystem II stability/assembly factor-like uncharacterized protein